MNAKDDLIYKKYQERIRSEQTSPTIIFDSKQEQEEYELSLQSVIKIGQLINKQKNQKTLTPEEQEQLQELFSQLKPRGGMIVYED